MTFFYEPSRSQVGEEVGFLVSVSDGEYTVTDSVTYVVTDHETSDPPGDPFPWGTVFAVALVLVIVAGIMVALFVKRRPGRQG